MTGFDDSGTQLFLVRVWQHLRGFRAAVRTLDEDEPRLFTEAQQVGEFLGQAVAMPDDATASASEPRIEEP